MDGLPCNRACQSYMAWSRQLLSKQTAPVSPQPAPSQLVQSSSRTKVQRTAKIRKSTPNFPAHVAKKAAPKRIEALPTNTADPQLENREEEKSTLAVKTDLSPAPNPASRSEAETKPPEPVAAVDDLATGSLAPDKQADGHTDPPRRTAALPTADTDTTGLAPPNNADQLVAIFSFAPKSSRYPI